jgi:hypothetical protein
MVQLTTKLLLQLYLQLYINDEMTCGIFVIAIQSVLLLIYWLVGRLGRLTNLGRPSMLGSYEGGCTKRLGKIR